MVLYSKTLKPLHDLTEEGKQNYKEFLNTYTNNLLIKANHPLLFILKTIFSFLKINSSLIDHKYNKLLKDMNDTLK